MTVGELLARTSSRELTEWLAFEQMAGPVGEVRADQRAALVASTIANTARDSKKRRKPYRLDEFMLRYAATESDEERARRLLERVVQLNQLFGGQDLRGVQ